MKAILIATKETIDVIKAEEYTNIYVTEDGSQSFLGLVTSKTAPCAHLFTVRSSATN